MLSTAPTPAMRFTLSRAVSSLAASYFETTAPSESYSFMTLKPAKRSERQLKSRDSEFCMRLPIRLSGSANLTLTKTVRKHENSEITPSLTSMTSTNALSSTAPSRPCVTLTKNEAYALFIFSTLLFSLKILSALWFFSKYSTGRSSICRNRSRLKSYIINLTERIFKKRTSISKRYAAIAASPSQTAVLSPENSNAVTEFTTSRLSIANSMSAPYIKTIPASSIVK